MKKILIFLFLPFMVCKVYGQQLKAVWVLPAGSPGWDVITSIAGTKDGNIVVCGAFYDSLTFENATLKSKGSRDCFLALVSGKGEMMKLIPIGGKGFDYIRKIEPDAGGGVSVIIEFNEKIEIGKNPIPVTGANNYAIAVFDKNLNFKNCQVIAVNKTGKISGIKNNKDGNTVFAGWFEDSLKVNNFTYMTECDENIFLGNMSNTLKSNWIKNFNVAGKDVIKTLCTDDSGSIYSLGTTANGNFDEIRKISKKGSNLTPVFVLKSSGQEGKTQDLFYPVTGTEIDPVDILSNSSSVWILANFKYSAIINENEITSEGMNDVLLIKYEYLTEKISYYQFGGTGNELGVGLAKFGEKILITGSYSGEVTFNTKTFKPKGFGTDIFIAAFNKDCTPDYFQPFEGEKSEFPCSIFCSGSRIYVAGQFTGMIPFGLSDYTSKGSEDIFMACMEQCPASTPLSITTKLPEDNLLNNFWELTAPDGFADYLWGENLSDNRTLKVNKPGTYLLTVTDYSGCIYRDSVVLSAEKSAKINQPDFQSQSFSLYPTLTTGDVFWQPSLNWIGEKGQLRILDYTGKVVSQTVIGSIQDMVYKISFSDKTEGAYLIEVSGSFFRETSKVILKR